MTLLCSGTFPSFLLQALPYIFLTQSQDYVSPFTLADGFPPPDLRITKHFYKPEVRRIQTRFEEVKQHAPGSVEQWLKDLTTKQLNSAEHARRWEQWEARGGLKKVNIRPSARPQALVRKSSAPGIPGTSEPQTALRSAGLHAKWSSDVRDRDSALVTSPAQSLPSKMIQSWSVCNSRGC